MNVLPYLKNRECGHKKGKTCVEELLESRAADPAINKPCQLQGHARSTFLMDFSADRRKVASTHGDHSVRVTDLASGKCTHVLRGHSRTPWCLAFHPSSNEILASGCLGGEVRIWDLHGGGSELFHSPGDNVIASMAFHPSDHVLVFATSNKLFFWDWCKPEPFICCKTREEYERIRWVRFDPLGHNLYTGIANGSTIQRDETSHLTQNSDVPADLRHDGRLRMLQQRYRTLLTRFQTYQAHRENDHPRNRRNENSNEQDFLMMRPPSPVHAEALDLAQDYAARVTASTAGLRQSRQYAASVTQDARRAMLFEHHGLNRPIPEGAELQARLRSGRENLEHSVPRGQTSPPPRRGPNRSSHPVTLASNETASASHVDVLSLSDAARDISSIQRPLFVNTQETTVDNSFYPPVSGSSVLSMSSSRSRPVHLNTSVTMSQRPQNSLVDMWSNAVRQSAPTSPFAGLSSPGSSLSPSASLRLSPGISNRSQLTSPGGSSILRTRLNAVQDNIPHSNPSQSSAFKSAPVVIFGREESLNRQSPKPGSSSSQTLSDSSANLNLSTSNNTSVVTQSSSACSSVNQSTVSNSVSSSNKGNLRKSDVPCESSSKYISGTTANNEVSSTVMSPNTCETSGSHSVIKSVPGTSDSSRLTEPDSTTGNNPTTSANSDRAGSIASENSSNSRQSSLTGVQRRDLLLTSDDPLPSSSLTGSSLSTNRTNSILSSATTAISRAGFPVSANSSQILSSNIPRPTALRTVPDLSLLGFRRIPSEALLSTAVMTTIPSDTAVLSHHPAGNSSLTRGNNPAERQTSQGGATSNRSDSQAQYIPLVNTLDEHASIRNMTSRLAQEINVLDRMIAMRERFSVQPHEIQSDRAESLNNVSVNSGSSSVATIPEITITEHQIDQATASNSQQQDSASTLPSGPNPPDVLPDDPDPPRDDVEPPPESALQGLDRTWRTLQRRHLHPHYGVSILDETINRPNNALQAAINRAIAGAFMGTGEAAVASNIINLTHRIQCWDFTQCYIPDISNASTNIVVPYCKIHNDASCDISQDGTYLATFVPSHRGFPDDTILAVFSLLPSNKGDCLFTKSFGPNAISVSLSPLKSHLVVGLASRRLSWVYTASQVVGQVYKLTKAKAGEASMEAVTNIYHPCDVEIQSHISVNSVRWLPEVGEGLVYGTNKGDLHICRPGTKIVVEKEDSEVDIVQGDEGRNNNNSDIRHNLMNISRTINAAIQTIHRSRRSAATQTEQLGQGQQIPQMELGESSTANVARGDDQEETDEIERDMENDEDR